MRKILLGVSIIILFYTRLVGLDWGLPYPMHPDERNMVNAIQQLSCEKLSISNFKLQISNCLNPHFFAYGQFPLYLAYGVVGVMKFFDGDLGTPIGYQEATMALRFISAVASFLNAIVLFRILQFLIRNFKFEFNLKLIKNFKFQISNLLILIFSPYAIQFSHFGTTESLLMLFYSLIVYECIKLLQNKITNNYYLLAIVSGLAIATKVSSVIFLAVPIAVMSYMFIHPLRQKKYMAEMLLTIFEIAKFMLYTFVVFVIFSPHNIISFPDFISSIRYESSVALGSYVAFYTRQFVGTTPLLFQLSKIFPYALGWPQYILAILGFFLLSWKNRYINLLRFAFLVYFIPTSFMFAKWSRFMAPVFPIMSVFAILFLNKIFNKFITVIKFIIIIMIILPGLAYLSIYQNPDVRFEASRWIYQNIPAGSKILSETANVVDIPIQSLPSTFKVPSSTLNRPPSSYQLASFNFYDLDENPALPVQLDQLIEGADYIIIPSRRIFANYTCLTPLSSRASVEGSLHALMLGRDDSMCKLLEQQHSRINNYYQHLFSKSGFARGFEKVAEFSSYPKIELFGKTLFEFPDEEAEETWTVFDHPVIRIYKKIPNPKFKILNKSQILNLKNYKSIFYSLPSKLNLPSSTVYHLLIADSPEKWEKGLMYVRNKEDIGELDGMLFQFPDKKIRTFWNKNTVSNLDLYWIDGDKIVGTSKLPAIGKSGEIITASSPQWVDGVVEIIR